MKKILIALVALVPFLSFGQSDDTTQYTYYRNVYGNRTDRVWGNKVLRAPLDTIYSKSGLAILAGVLYVGNGVQWSQVTGGGGGSDSGIAVRNGIKATRSPTSPQRVLEADSSAYSTRARSQKLIDSLNAIFNAAITSYKLKGDSAGLGGYTTVATKNKLADSLTANFNALLTLYKLKGDSVALGGYTTVAHANKIADSLRVVFNTLLGGKVDTGTKANTYINNPGTGIHLLYARDSNLFVKTIQAGTNISIDNTTDTNTLVISATGGAGFDSASSQGGGFHTDGFNQVKYLQIKDSTKYATFARLYKTLDSLNLIVVKKGDSTLYSTFARLYKVVDSLNLVMLHKSDSAGVGYTTLARTRKVIDSLGLLITAAASDSGITAGYGIGVDRTSPTLRIVRSDTGSTANSLKKAFLPLHFEAAKIVNQHNFDITYTGGGRVIFDSTKYTASYSNPIIASHATVMTAAGNSIGYSSQASTPDSGYAGRVARYVSLPLTNLSIPGIKEYDIIGILLANVNPGHSSFTVMEGGINGLRSFSSANTINSIANAFGAGIVNQYLATYVSGSDASITRTGTWVTGYNFAVNGFGKTTTAAYTNGHIGDVASWTSPASTSVALQIAGNVGGGATVTVVIDGVTMEVIATANQVETGSYIPMARAYTGLSNTAHTVTLTFSAGSGLFILDYIGTLVSAPILPFVVVDVPYLDFTNGTAAGADTKVRTDTTNNRLTVLVNLWRSRGFPVYEALTNTIYTATLGTDLYSDGVHPNDLGHYRIFQSVIGPLFTASYSDGTIVHGNDGYFYGSKNGVLNRIAYQPEMNLQAVLNNGTTITSPFYINGNGFKGSINNFSQLYLDSLFWVKNTGTINSSMVGVRGQLSVNGGAAAMIINQRNNDTTRGFQLYAQTGALIFYDALTGRDLGFMDSSYKTRLYNDFNSHIVNNNSSSHLLDAVLYIDGNRIGKAGRTSIKLDGSKLVIVPEPGAIETDKFNIYYTDSLFRQARILRQFDLDSVRAGQLAAINFSRKLSGDTTTYKPVVRDASGNLFYSDWAGFLALAGSGASAPFSDGTALVKNSADATKLLKISSVNITTATTRTLTAPDWDGIIATANHANTWTGAQDMSGATVTVSKVLTSGSAPSGAIGSGTPNGGAGANLSFSTGSNAMTGEISLVTGTGTGSGQVLATITLPAQPNNYRVFLQDTYPSILHVNVTVTRSSSTQFVIQASGTESLAASTIYSWNYLIVN